MTRQTSSDRVFDALRAAILSGELAAGSQHSIYGIAAQMEVSRTPAREAVLRLADAGLVAVEKNRGFRVRGVTADGVRSVFEMRLLLEVPAAAYAASVCGPDLKVSLSAALKTLRDNAERADEDSFMTADRRLHGLIAESLGNPRLTEDLTRLRDGIQVRGVSTVGRSRDMPAIAEEHAPIVAAITAQDPGEAAQRMWQHLVHTGTLLLAQVSGGSAEYVDGSWAERLRPLLR
ncbi:MAG: GntR family transcriptional regulator [Mycobacterium sp.]